MLRSIKFLCFDPIMGVMAMYMAVIYGMFRPAAGFDFGL
jgi:hypothetical protein